MASNIVETVKWIWRSAKSIFSGKEVRELFTASITDALKDVEKEYAANSKKITDQQSAEIDTRLKMNEKAGDEENKLYTKTTDAAEDAEGKKQKAIKKTKELQIIGFSDILKQAQKAANSDQTQGKGAQPDKNLMRVGGGGTSTTTAGSAVSIAMKQRDKVIAILQQILESINGAEAAPVFG